jgi:hypothetical protein
VTLTASGLPADDFIARHRACGTMTGDATEPAPSGYMLSVVCSLVSCSCGG